MGELAYTLATLPLSSKSAVTAATVTLSSLVSLNLALTYLSPFPPLFLFVISLHRP
jgi:hypothetical protein